MHILLIEPNKRRAAQLNKLFKRMFYETDVFLSAELALTRAERRDKDYDLILLNMHQDDFAVDRWCEAIREQHSAIPIIALSKEEDDELMIDMLLTYADDFIKLPIKPEELLARIQAVMRRPRPLESTQLSIGSAYLDINQRSVLHSDSVIQFSRKEFLIVEYLAQHINKVVDKADLIGHVWELPEAVLQNNLDAHIKNIRKKLRPVIDCELQTVRGIGYKLCSA